MACLRFMAEYFREPDAHLGLLLRLGMSMGQWLCACPWWLGGAMACGFARQIAVKPNFTVY